MGFIRNPQSPSYAGDFLHSSWLGGLAIGIGQAAAHETGTIWAAVHGTAFFDDGTAWTVAAWN